MRKLTTAMWHVILFLCWSVASYFKSGPSLCLLYIASEAMWQLFCCPAMSSVNQLRPGSSPMYVGPAAHFSQASTSAMTVPPPSYMLPQRHQPSPQPTSAPARSHDEKEQKNNALLILKMLCETPLLQAYLLDFLKARFDIVFDILLKYIANKDHFMFVVNLYGNCFHVALLQ